MAKQETIKIVTPSGKVINYGLKAWRESTTLREQGYAEYREPVQPKKFAPIVAEPIAEEDDVTEAAKPRGRPKKEKE